MASVSSMHFEIVDEDTKNILIDIKDVQTDTIVKFKIKRTDTICKLIKKSMEYFPEYEGKFVLRSGKVTIGSKSVPINKKINEVWTDKVKVPHIVLLTQQNIEKQKINSIYTAIVLVHLEDNIPTNLYSVCPFNGIRIGRIKKNDKKPRNNNHYNNLVIMKTPYGDYLVNVYCFYELISGKGCEIGHKFQVKITFDSEKVFILPKREYYKDEIDRHIQIIKKTPNPLKREFKLVVLDLLKSESITSGLKRIFKIGEYSS